MVKAQKWSSSANLEELGRVNPMELPEGKSWAQLGEGGLGVGNFSLFMGVCVPGRAELRKS